MQTSLEHLPSNKQDEIRRIVEIIRDEISAVELEMIVLFGSHARGDWVEDAYVGEDGIYYKYRSDFDILVVTAHRKTAKKAGKWHRLRERIRHTVTVQTPVTVISHEIRFINKCLRKGNYFFADIQKEGVLLYTSAHWEFAEPRELTPEERKLRAEEDFEFWFKSANNYFRFFQVGFEEGLYKESAFQLHQVTEKLYSTILLVFTGYKPKTHDLEELGELITLHKPNLIRAIFPNKTDREKYLFTLLRNAYVESRYNKNYVITREELAWLGERVKTLQQSIEKICRKQIEGYSKSV